MAAGQTGGRASMARWPFLWRSQERPTTTAQQPGPRQARAWPISQEAGIAARGESPAAFGRRCIPPGCVAPRSNTPGILTRRALPAGRIAALGATPDFRHGLIGPDVKALVDFIFSLSGLVISLLAGVLWL